MDPKEAFDKMSLTRRTLKLYYKQAENSHAPNIEKIMAVSSDHFPFLILHAWI